MTLTRPSSPFDAPAHASCAVRFAGATDRGLRRSRNEDALLVAADHGLMAVADGMGGHANGDVASQLAIETIATFFRRQLGWETSDLDDDVTADEHCLSTALRLANWRLYYGAAPEPGAGFGMGTTLVAALFGDAGRTITVAHVGDSRAYRLRAGVIERLTHDHSVREECARRASRDGTTPLRLPQNVLTRAIGVEPDVDIDLLQDETEPGDVYLLCSDGLWARASNDDIAAVLERSRTLEVGCAALVALANQRGGGDNITVTLARVDALAPPPRSRVSAR
ncbi:MAG TPA: protein phosphatase 2C domain-containing protein [Byssovorax sp.]|jgi:protein phosphatase